MISQVSEAKDLAACFDTSGTSPVAPSDNNDVSVSNENARDHKNEQPEASEEAEKNDATTVKAADDNENGEQSKSTTKDEQSSKDEPAKDAEKDDSTKEPADVFSDTESKSSSKGMSFPPATIVNVHEYSKQATDASGTTETRVVRSQHEVRLLGIKNVVRRVQLGNGFSQYCCVDHNTRCGDLITARVSSKDTACCSPSGITMGIAYGNPSGNSKETRTSR